MNVASTCWGMINGVSVALAVQQFKRRTVYLVRQSSSFFEFEIEVETTDLYHIHASHLRYVDYCK